MSAERVAASHPDPLLTAPPRPNPWFPAVRRVHGHAGQHVVIDARTGQAHVWAESAENAARIAALLNGFYRVRGSS